MHVWVKLPWKHAYCTGRPIIIVDQFNSLTAWRIERHHFHVCIPRVRFLSAIISSKVNNWNITQTWTINMGYLISKLVILKLFSQIVNVKSVFKAWLNVIKNSFFKIPFCCQAQPSPSLTGLSSLVITKLPRPPIPIPRTRQIRERERYRQTDRQTDRQRKREIYWCTI